MRLDWVTSCKELHLPPPPQWRRRNTQLAPSNAHSFFGYWESVHHKLGDITSCQIWHLILPCSLVFFALVCLPRLPPWSLPLMDNLLRMPLDCNHVGSEQAVYKHSQQMGGSANPLLLIGAQCVSRCPDCGCTVGRLQGGSAAAKQPAMFGSHETGHQDLSPFQSCYFIISCHSTESCFLFLFSLKSNSGMYINEY